MKDITVVIRHDNDKYIYEHLSLLSPLFDNYSVQLCILTNAIKSLSISYDYSLIHYDNKIKDLLKFLEGISKYNRVLFIDKGILLNQELVDCLKEKLKDDNENSYKVKVINYFNENDFYEDSQIILFNKKSDEVVELDCNLINYMLIEANSDDLELVLKNFIDKKQYENICNWYRFTIIKRNEININAFFEALESIKLTLHRDQEKEIEQYFLDNNYDEHYFDYLNIKKMIINRSCNTGLIVSNVSSTFFNMEKYKYSAFIIYHALKNNSSINSFYKIFNDDILSSILAYLMKVDENFYIHLYEHIISIDVESEISRSDNYNILYYLSAVRSYMVNMCERSYTEDLKEKLVQVFVEYTNYLFYIVNRSNKIDVNLISLEEQTFILDIDKAIGYIDSGNLKEGIVYLEKASLIIEYATLPARYYIQKLIRENETFYTKLSFCLIVKNEEKHIKRCMESIKPLTDCGIAEIIIVDTGSTDKTVEIASKYTQNIYFYAWKDDFAKARNYSIAMAKGEYVFILDADEELDKKSLEEFKNMFQSDEYKKYNTFSFKEKNFYEDNLKYFGVFTRNFIFKNNAGFCYLGSVHEQPQFKPNVKNLNMFILHYGYIMDDEVKERKYVRNAELLKKELSLNSNNLYYRYQLCTTYVMHSDFKEALVEAEILLSSIEETEFVKMHLSYYNAIALVYACNSMYDKVIEICDIALSHQPDFIDFLFDKAQALFIKEEYQLAIEYIEKYLDLLKEFEQHEIFNDVRFLFHTLDSKDKAINLVMVSYYVQKKYSDLIRYVSYIDDDIMLKNSLRVIVESYIKTNKFEELYSFYENKILSHSDRDIDFIFNYFIQKESLLIEKKIREELFEYFPNLAFEVSEREENSEHEAFLDLVSKYDISECDAVTAKLFVYDILNLLEKYSYVDTFSDIKAESYKKCLRFMLIRTLTVKQFKGLSKVKLLDLTNKYISLGLMFIDTGRKNVLETKEHAFFNFFKNAFSELERGNVVGAIRNIKEAIVQDNEMARPMELLLSEILPQYNISFN